MTADETALRGHKLFREREGLAATAAALGHTLDLEPEIRDALTPARVGSRQAGNRFVIHPMEGCDGTLDGRPGELTFRRWGRFARGGAKILWGEATAILPEARANARQLLLTHDTVDDFSRLVEHARSEHRRQWGTDDDFLIGAQLTHSGRWSHAAPLPPAELSETDRERLTQVFCAAARLAVRAGVDFIDIKQCHGYLLSEILAQPGELAERIRFARGVLRAVRRELPEGVFLATRMNAFDGPAFRADPKGAGEPLLNEPAGFGACADDPLTPDLHEPIEAIRGFVEDGIALVNITAGCPYRNFHIGRPADRPAVDGYAAPEHPLDGVARHMALTAGIQDAFPSLPVVGTGYSYLRHFLAEAAEANIRAGRTTFAGVGRGALAYPDFVRDLLDTGTMDPKKTCITVSHCTTLMRSKGGELGQFPSGCVPRDPVYARLLQEARRVP